MQKTNNKARAKTGLNSIEIFTPEGLCISRLGRREQRNLHPKPKEVIQLNEQQEGLLRRIYKSLVAEESGSRTHLSTLACLTGFEVRPSHRESESLPLCGLIITSCALKHEVFLS
jgi:hypothetical protein